MVGKTREMLLFTMTVQQTWVRALAFVDSEAGDDYDFLFTSLWLIPIIFYLSDADIFSFKDQ